MTPIARQFLADDGGATAIEYSLIAALIFLVIVASLTIVGAKTTSMFTLLTGVF